MPKFTAAPKFHSNLAIKLYGVKTEGLLHIKYKSGLTEGPLICIPECPSCTVGKTKKIYVSGYYYHRSRHDGHYTWMAYTISSVDLEGVYLPVFDRDTNIHLIREVVSVKAVEALASELNATIVWGESVTIAENQMSEPLDPGPQRERFYKAPKGWR